jgi:putative two-component system response regulator
MCSHLDHHLRARQCKGRALVVDDERQVRDLLTRWLTGDGWICQTATDGNEALKILDARPPDVVICDINMPYRSGVWLLEKITTQFGNIAVLMLTGSRETKMAIECLTKGAYAYLLKPVEQDELLWQLDRANERRELLIEREQKTLLLEARVREQTEIIKLAHEETIQRLVGAAAYRDEETGAHIRRTGLFAETLALAAGWTAEQSEDLRMAAPMHDIGKIGIPDSILHKKGSLTKAEYDVMKQHTLIGAKMLTDPKYPVLELARSIALNHHERWDGLGYPNGLFRDAIPEPARIVSIVDVFDALSHDRVYRKALADEHVLDLMHRGMGSQFDPSLLALFLTIYDDVKRISDENPDNMLGTDLGYEPRIERIQETAPATTLPV